MKITRSQLNQIISEEVQRMKKIKTLNERKESIKKELKLINEFNVVAPGDKESLKSLTQNGRPYLNSLNTLAKKYPDSKFPKMVEKFVLLHKEAESILAGIAIKGDGKEGAIEQTPAMPGATVSPVPAPAPTPFPSAPTTIAEDNVEEGLGLSQTNQRGQNVKPQVPHMKPRPGITKK